MGGHKRKHPSPWDGDNADITGIGFCLWLDAQARKHWRLVGGCFDEWGLSQDWILLSLGLVSLFDIPRFLSS